MTKFQIKSRFNSAQVVFECELTAEVAKQNSGIQLGFAIRKALKEGADLGGANLEDAYLEGTYLKDANLEGAYLRGAYLRGAYLRGANLRGAYLGGADLEGADLGGADLEGANLRGAYLRGAYLRGANLENIKKDFLIRLSTAKNEALGLYDYLMKGKINGSVYEGKCACFCGTIANIRHENYRAMGIDLRPDSNSPTERWFLAINRGDIPQNNPVSAITAQWLREFMDSEGIEYPEYEIVAIKTKE